MNNIDEKFEVIFENILNEYNELKEFVSSVEIMSDNKLYNFYLKKIKNIENIANKIEKLKTLDNDICVLNDMKNEDNQCAEIESEIQNLQKTRETLLKEIKQDYAQSKLVKNEKVKIEITPKEDVDFANLLAGIFEKFSLNSNYKFNKQMNDDGSIAFEVEGDGAYNFFAVFNGKVKRILRGIESNILVVVLKLENSKIEINEDDLIIQTSKSSGAGGQHINKTESAIKIIHKPTGIFGECQDERSQTKNKERAMERLIEKINRENENNKQKNEEIQRAEIKSKLFASTANIVFDFDANRLFVNSNKTEYKLKDIEEGKINLIFDNSVV